MSMTVCIHIEHRSIQRCIGQIEHDLRTGLKPRNVDSTKTKLNSILINPTPADVLRKTCEERRALRHMQRAMKSNAAVSTNGIISFGYEAQRVILCLSRAKQDELYAKCAAVLADLIDTDLTGLVVHRDESGPHAHFQMSAYCRNGLPNCKKIDADMAVAMQTAAGQVYANEGIFRGVPKAIRVERGDSLLKIIHRSVAQLHSDLPLEIAQLDLLKNNVVETIEKLDSVVDDLSALRDLQRSNIAEANEQLKNAEVVIAQRANYIADLDSAIAERVDAVGLLDTEIGGRRSEIGGLVHAVEIQGKALFRIQSETETARVESEKERAVMLAAKEQNRLRDMQRKGLSRIVDTQLEEKQARIKQLENQSTLLESRICALDKELAGKADLAILLANVEQHIPKPTPAPALTQKQRPDYITTNSYPRM